MRMGGERDTRQLEKKKEKKTPPKLERKLKTNGTDAGLGKNPGKGERVSNEHSKFQEKGRHGKFKREFPRKLFISG